MDSSRDSNVDAANAANEVASAGSNGAPAAALTETEAIRLAQAGDAEAFEFLYQISSTASYPRWSSTSGCWRRAWIRACRCSSGSSSCASRRAISTNSSRSASPASSSCSSSARPRSAPTVSALAEQLAAIHQRATRPGARSVRLPERRAAAGAARRRHRRARCGGLGRRHARVGRASLPGRGRAGAEPARPGSGAAVSAHPEQEPELHRATVGQGRLRPRQRARHRAGAALAAAHRGAARRRRAAPLRGAVDHRRSHGRAPVRRRAGAGLLSVPSDAQQRSVRRR